MPGVLTPPMVWGGWTGRMTAGNGPRGYGGVGRESLLLSKPASVPLPPPGLCLRAQLGGF